MVKKIILGGQFLIERWELSLVAFAAVEMGYMTSWLAWFTFPSQLIIGDVAGLLITFQLPAYLYWKLNSRGQLRE